MRKRSFFYKNSWFYTNLLKLTHGENFVKRYEYMAKKMGKNMSILEPGAGPGIIPPFLDKTCSYYGFDINPDFVNNARKRGIDIQLGNMLDKKAYKKSDAAILVDVLHHLKPSNQKILLKNTYDATGKTIIICEPFMHAFPVISKIPVLSGLQKKFFEFIEQDGNNEARIEHVHSKEGLRRDMKDGFGIIPAATNKEIVELGDDLIVTYHLK